MALFKTQLHKGINFKIFKERFLRNLTHYIHTAIQRALKQDPKLLQNIKPTLTYLHENTTHKAK
jgi:hypothetical protein